MELTFEINHIPSTKSFCRLAGETSNIRFVFLLQHIPLNPNHNISYTLRT